MDKNKLAVRRLNPYYTGIHLHFYNDENEIETRVLILIILEYIYIILKQEDLMLWDIVLILIILEYIYIEMLSLLRKGFRRSLNPYYTGIHLHTVKASTKPRPLMS